MLVLRRQAGLLWQWRLADIDFAIVVLLAHYEVLASGQMGGRVLRPQLR